MLIRLLRPAIVALPIIAFTACRSETPKLDQPPDSAAAAAAPKPVAADTTAPISNIPLSAWKISPAGFGPLRAGMSVSQVDSLVPKFSAPADIKSSDCTYGRSTSLPSGAVLMFAKGSLARIDILSGNVQSDLGARIGDTEDQLKLLYGKAVRTTPHKYTDGHYMTVLSESDSSFRIVFETDGQKVIRYRSGRTPEVEYVEGCG
jgi:hypothetical protein